MRWFKKAETPKAPKAPRPTSGGGFVLGDVVQHKVSAHKGVIIMFNRNGEQAKLSNGFYSANVIRGVFLSELEKAQPVVAQPPPADTAGL